MLRPRRNPFSIAQLSSDYSQMMRLQLSGHRSFAVVTALGASLVAGAGSKAPVKAGRPAISVAVVPVKKITLPYTVEANGIVSPIQAASVASQVDGIIIDVPFAEGAEVKKGQILFKIEPHPYQAAYDMALAQLARDKATAENAKNDYDRFEKLRKEKVVSATATSASTVACVDPAIAAFASASAADVAVVSNA